MGSDTTVRFVLSDRTGTFSNINAYIYFSTQKNKKTHIVLDNNNILASRVQEAIGQIILFDTGPPHFPENRPRLTALLGPRFKGGEHMLATTFQRADLKHRRRQLRQAFDDNFYFKPDVMKKAAPLVSQIQALPAVGAHVRFTGHYSRKINIDEMLDCYIKRIDSALNEKACEQLFVATHLEYVLQKLKVRYGQKLLQYQQYRNPDRDSDWFNNKPIEVERQEVVIDMLGLAACQTVIGGPSNVFYAALWYQSDLDFEILPILNDVNGG